MAAVAQYGVRAEAGGVVSPGEAEDPACAARSERPTRRALVLHDRPLVVDLITLTLNHGVFAVRAATTLAEAKAIVAERVPNIGVVDMDHDDNSALLKLLGASRAIRRSGTPVLGLTRMGDLKTRLRAFDLGVDDILTIPFSPGELLARAIVITRRASGTDRSIIPAIRLGEIEIDILNREVRAGDSVARIQGPTRHDKAGSCPLSATDGKGFGNASLGPRRTGMAMGRAALAMLAWLLGGVPRHRPSPRWI
jgi:CheY-like chemotaxis protein